MNSADCSRSGENASSDTDLIEHDHRRRRTATLAPRRVLLRPKFAIAQRSRPLHDPDVTALVDSDTRDLTENPVVGERLGPERVDLTLRR
jgi:hypothetical protein